MEEVQRLRTQIDTTARANLRAFIRRYPPCGTPYEEPHSAEDGLERFFFCLLGGYSITYELNQIAFSNFAKRIGFHRQALLANDFAPRVARVLRALEIDETGRTVSYRFPNSKAKTLASAAHWLERLDLWDLRVLRVATPREGRELLITCPGIGLKTASWFLRNIGHGRGLAILDVHLDRIAKQWLLIPSGLSTSKDYLEMEGLLQGHCNHAGIDISEIDLALWRFARGDDPSQ